MDNRRYIKKYFDKFIDDNFKEKHDIKNFLKKHERKNVVIDNLEREIKLIEIANIRSFQITSFSELVRDVARMFCINALKSKEQQLLSLSAKIQQEKEFRKNSLDELDQELPEGVISVERSPTGRT